MQSAPENIYLKTCFTRFPGAQSVSLHTELPQGELKVSSYSSRGFSLHRGRWQIPLFSPWQWSWQVLICSWQKELKLSQRNIAEHSDRSGRRQMGSRLAIYNWLPVFIFGGQEKDGLWVAGHLKLASYLYFLKWMIDGLQVRYLQPASCGSSNWNDK